MLSGGRSLTYQGVEDGGDGPGHHHAQDGFGPISLAVHKHQAHIFEVTHGPREELHQRVRQPIAGQHLHSIFLDCSDAPVQGLQGREEPRPAWETAPHLCRIPPPTWKLGDTLSGVDNGQCVGRVYSRVHRKYWFFFSFCFFAHISIGLSTFWGWDTCPLGKVTNPSVSEYQKAVLRVLPKELMFQNSYLVVTHACDPSLRFLSSSPARVTLLIFSAPSPPSPDPFPLTAFPPERVPTVLLCHTRVYVVNLREACNMLSSQWPSCSPPPALSL